jgi:hypothetical protein
MDHAAAHGSLIAYSFFQAISLFGESSAAVGSCEGIGFSSGRHYDSVWAGDIIATQVAAAPPSTTPLAFRRPLTVSPSVPR